MSSTERISFLQEKLQEIRKYYLSLKSEVASIDRRRKRLKKKEREGEAASRLRSSGRLRPLTANQSEPICSLSVQHNGVHVVGVLGHRHESVLGLARTEHCCCGVQVMTRRVLQPDSAHSLGGLLEASRVD